MKKKKSIWADKEKCRQAAMSCSSRTEFQHKYPQAYLNSKDWGLLEEWIPSQKKERTYDRFIEIAKACTTKSQVKNIDASVYIKARKEGWFKDCPWIIEHDYKPNKWIDDERWKAALQCKTRSEYCHRFNGAWAYDNRHGLLDRYTHFVKPIHEGRDPNAEDYVIYLYRDFEHKVVYVGLTYEERKKQRHNEHIYGRKENGIVVFDVAARYWQSIGQPLPDPVYVMEGLHINDVGHYEGWYIDKYKENGWTVLNIAKAGSTGGAKVKWNTYEAVAEKSKEYETRSQFCHGCSQAAKKAYDSYTEDGIRWIDTFYWLKDIHEARSEASRKRQTGKKQSEESKRKKSEALKKYYAEHPKPKGVELSEGCKKKISDSLKKFHSNKVA